MEAFYMAITGILNYLWLNQAHVETDVELQSISNSYCKNSSLFRYWRD